MVKRKDNRNPKQFLYGELAKGKGPVPKLKLRSKNYIKNALLKADM